MHDDAETDFQSVFDSSYYESPQNSPTQDLNKAFFNPSPTLSICSMTSSVRQRLEEDFERSSTGTDSLAWDNSECTTTLTNPLDLTRLYSPQENDDTHSEPPDECMTEQEVSIMESSWRSSTPGRVTRSMVSSGEYELTLSPIPFERNSRLRRPLVRSLNWAPEIADIAGAAASRRPKQPVKKK